MDKFNLDIPEIYYDLIGIFIPGFFSYFCLTIILPKKILISVMSNLYINEMVIKTFIVYLLGHAIYSLSSVSVARFFNMISGNPTFTLLGAPLKNRQKMFNKHFLREDINHDKYFMETILKGVKAHTGLIDFDLKRSENLDIAFEFCRNFVMEKTQRNYATIRKEQAYGEMARGIVFVCLLCIVLVILLNKFFFPIEYFYSIHIFLVITLISFAFRYGQARHIGPIFIYSTFCSFINQVEEPKSKIVI